MITGRDRTACMMRCRNEARWIRRSLERTFQVARTVVIWDDGSDDDMIEQATTFLDPHAGLRWSEGPPNPWILEEKDCALHIVYSPFRQHVVRTKEAVNEIRDKNCLWSYCKSSVDFEIMLCLDGDEILTQEAVREWPQAVERLATSVDVLHLPFIYLWDSEDRRRVDGIYGDVPNTLPRYARLNFPRVFTIRRLTPAQLFDTCFQWFGTQGSMHCGSIPRQNFRPNNADPTSALAFLPVAHMGYIDADLRQRKFEFYNLVDPSNDAEGRYEHIVGRPDIHAPGPLEFVAWEDK